MAAPVPGQSDRGRRGIDNSASTQLLALLGTGAGAHGAGNRPAFSALIDSSGPPVFCVTGISRTSGRRVYVTGPLTKARAIQERDRQEFIAWQYFTRFRVDVWVSRLSQAAERGLGR